MNSVEQYSRNNQSQKAISEKFFNNHGDKLRKEFDDKEIEVLDIGSGCGQIFNEVFVPKSGLKLSKVIGVDMSEEMVKFANENYGSDSMSFFVMDASKEVPENLKKFKFDLVTSFFCMHWITDLDKAFQNVHNFLKPNGIFCCIFTQVPKAQFQGLIESDNESFKNVFANIFPNFQLLSDPCEVIKKHLNDNGMEILHFIDVEEHHKFDSLEAIKGYNNQYLKKKIK